MELERFEPPTMSRDIVETIQEKTILKIFFVKIMIFC